MPTQVPATLRDILTRTVLCVTEETLVKDTLRIMKAHRVSSVVVGRGISMTLHQIRLIIRTGDPYGIIATRKRQAAVVYRRPPG